MEKKQIDLLRRRVKLGAQTDALFAQLVEVLRELQQVHAEISMEVGEKEQRDVNSIVSNVISNFPRIMVKRLEMAIESRPSSSEQSLEEVFTKDNVGIAARLETPVIPKESLMDHNRRIGIKIHKEERS